MIVINDNKKYKEITCPNCGSLLGVEENDVREIEYGCLIVDCPCCGEEIEYGEITITGDNVKFPQHFYHFNGEITDDEVRDIIQKGITQLRKNKDNFGMYYVAGRTFVGIKRYPGDEEYTVIVTDDYYNTSIQFEDEDKWEGWDEFDEK